MLRLLFRRILPGILFVAVFAAGARAEDPAVTPSTALESYLHNGDLTYGWKSGKRCATAMRPSTTCC